MLKVERDTKNHGQEAKCTPEVAPKTNLFSKIVKHHGKTHHGYFGQFRTDEKTKVLSQCISVLQNAQRRSSHTQEKSSAHAGPIVGKSPAGSSAWDPAGSRGSDNFYGTFYNLQNGNSNTHGMLSAKDGALLANTILRSTAFLKFAPAGLMCRLVQSLRIRSVPSNEYIVKCGDSVPVILFLLRGHIGVYEVIATPSVGAPDEYGDTASEASCRVRVLTAMSVVEEKAVLFGKEAQASYKTLWAPGKSEGSVTICASLSRDSPGVQEMFDALADRYMARVAFTRTHLPSSVTEDALEKLSNACTEEVFLHKASLWKLMERVNERISFAVVSSGVVLCGPFDHPHVVLQEGAILGIQSKACFRGGVWARGHVVVRTWPYTRIVLPSWKKSIKEDVNTVNHLEMTLTVVKKEEEAPSAKQILNALSADHLQYVGGNSLQERLDRYRKLTSKPKKQYVSKPSSLWKWDELQRLCLRTYGTEELIRVDAVAKRRFPRCKEDTQLGPRSYALKARELMNRSTPMLQDAERQRPSTAGGFSAVAQSKTQSGRPATAIGLSAAPTVVHSNVAMAVKSRPKSAGVCRTDELNRGPARPKTSTGVRAVS